MRVRVHDHSMLSVEDASEQSLKSCHKWPIQVRIEGKNPLSAAYLLIPCKDIVVPVPVSYWNRKTKSAGE